MKKIIIPALIILLLISGQVVHAEVKSLFNFLISNPVAEGDHYTDNGDETITDTKTGLMWTKKDSFADLGKCLDWNDSKSYVSELRTGSHSDWRLPTLKELETIYERTKSNVMTYDNNKQYPLHLDSIFANGAAYGYWSSNTAGSCCALSLVFYYGNVLKEQRTYCNDGGVRAVRKGAKP